MPGSMLSWLPPALRLPLVAALIVFGVAVGTTQVALRTGSEEADVQLERLGQVYLDGLIALVRGSLESGNMAEVEERFHQAFAEQESIAERLLMAIPLDGSPAALVGDTRLADVARGRVSEPFDLDDETGTAWARRLVNVGPGYHLVAGLDVSHIIAARQRLIIGVVLVDLVIAAVCGLIAYGVLRRLNRPIAELMTHLAAAAHERPKPIPEFLIATADVRTAALYRAYNRMAAHVEERERLVVELAEKEQAAAFGRLAATIAHEVRNPLGGLSTAVSTLRKFGDDERTREESLGLLERGIASLDRIVTGTLDLYRPDADRRLTRADFEDLAYLAKPAADKAQVTLAWRLDLPDELALGAQGVRQVILNLLLNACAATRPGGKVTLDAHVEGSELICVVLDEGEGMESERAARLAGESADGEVSKRLGIDVIVGLLGHLEGQASVHSEPGKGTTVRVAIPLESPA